MCAVDLKSQRPSPDFPRSLLGAIGANNEQFASCPRQSPDSDDQSSIRTARSVKCRIYLISLSLLKAKTRPSGLISVSRASFAVLSGERGLSSYDDRQCFPRFTKPVSHCSL